jgi:hypothetical protein
MSTMDPTVTPVQAGTPIEEPHTNGFAASQLDAQPPEAEAQALETLEEVEQLVSEEVGAAIVSGDPTETGDLDEAALIGLGAQEPAAPAVAVRKRAVRGLYRSGGPDFRVDLRVDVDGYRPMKRVSADYYSVSGGTTMYVGSMRVDSPVITVSATKVTITGLGTYTWATGAPKVKITIPRVPVTSPAAPATLRHYTTSNAPAAVFVCKFKSLRFRSILLEEDRQSGVTPFVAYNTGSLPSPGPARVLNISNAYAEAGIEMQSTGMSNVVPTAAAGANGSWSDAELHAAMQGHFSKWVNLPQWAVWLLHAQLHDIGPNLLGIMFDQQGAQRQGAAVFYQGLAGSTADQQRLQLYTCVHELGHCFNLLHSWQKSFANPPAPNRPGSPSWMNYPWLFPGGPAAFWSAFPFQFDDLEVIHLRHAFRDNVIMGGNPFAVGAALERDPAWADPEIDESGLRLELAAPRSFPYGAPVSVDLALYGTSGSGRPVPKVLGPRPGLVEIAIQKPGGQALLFEPLLAHCRDGETVTLRAGDEPVQDSAFVHYGQDGLMFDAPGRYTLRARYGASDGSLVVSNVITINVLPPASQEDSDVAELLLGDEQGTLMSLLGSDAPQLDRGNEALQEIIERYPDHPLAAYAKVVRGTNLAREFKLVAADGSVTVRKPERKEALQLLGAVIDVNAMRKAAEGGEEESAMRMDAADALSELGSKPDISSIVDPFLKARRVEIATEVVETS